MGDSFLWSRGDGEGGAVGGVFGGDGPAQDGQGFLPDGVEQGTFGV